MDGFWFSIEEYKEWLKGFYVFELNCFIIICNGRFVLEWSYVNGGKNLGDDVLNGIKLSKINRIY